MQGGLVCTFCYGTTATIIHVQRFVRRHGSKYKNMGTLFRGHLNEAGPFTLRQGHRFGVFEEQGLGNLFRYLTDYVTKYTKC